MCQGGGRRERYWFLEQWYKGQEEQGKSRRPSTRKDLRIEHLLCPVTVASPSVLIALGPRTLPALHEAVWPKEKRTTALSLHVLENRKTHICATLEL